MRILLTAFLFCLASSIANAEAFQLQKPVWCEKKDVIINTLLEKFNEKPLWMGKGEGTGFVLFANEKTQTWTWIQFNDEVGCVLGTGTGNQLLLGAQI